MYADMFTCAAFNWQASPAVTELETIVMDMLADALGLDGSYKSSGEGGGVIFGTASEAALTMMITARDRLLDSESGSSTSVDSLVALVSDQTHSGVEKAAKLLRIKCHKIKTFAKEGYAITGASLRTALAELREKGLNPFFLCLTLGTTAVCAIDDFQTITSVLEEPENQMLWTHLDAAYAGAALICPEFQHHLKYSEKYDSFEMNAHKWLLTNFDCSCLWLRARKHLITAMDITPSYLRNPASDAGLVTDYRNWGIPLGRRFRALKLWFVFRTYGLSGMQAHIRKHVEFGRVFAGLVDADSTMEVVAQPRFALTVIRFVDGDIITRAVYERINAEGRLFLTSSVLDGNYVIRIVGCSPHVTREHLVGAYETLAQTYRTVKES